MPMCDIVMQAIDIYQKTPIKERPGSDVGLLAPLSQWPYQSMP